MQKLNRNAEKEKFQLQHGLKKINIALATSDFKNNSKKIPNILKINSKREEIWMC